MSEVARLVNQIERAVDGDAWHGDPVMAQLDRVTFETANAMPPKKTSNGNMLRLIPRASSISWIGNGEKASVFLNPASRTARAASTSSVAVSNSAINP